MAQRLSDPAIRAVLERTRTIALVGFSPNPKRPSHSVARFLVARGYRVIPVNPGHAGRDFWGEPVVGRLGDITCPVDMVDVFKPTDRVPGVFDEAVALLPGFQAFWLQLDIWGGQIAREAAERQITLIENRCPAIEIARLFPAGWRV